MATEIIAQGRVKLEWGASGVVTFTVCRPRVRNALDLETIEALDFFVQELERRPHVLVAIFEGVGESFISGGDLRQFSRLRGEEAGVALARRVSDIFVRLEDVPQVTIAAIGGDAYGGGCELALACDLRVIEEGSAMVFSQGRFGLTSGWGGTLRLVRLVGYSRALECFLTTRRVEAEEARLMGLVNEVVPVGEASARARALASRAGALGSSVVSSMKRVARFAVTANQDDALAEERRVFARLWASAAHEERVRQFLRDGERAEPGED